MYRFVHMGPLLGPSGQQPLMCTYLYTWAAPKRVSQARLGSGRITHPSQPTHGLSLGPERPATPHVYRFVHMGCSQEGLPGSSRLGQGQPSQPRNSSCVQICTHWASLGPERPATPHVYRFVHMGRSQEGLPGSSRLGQGQPSTPGGSASSPKT